MGRDEPQDNPIIIDPADATPDQLRLAEQGLGWGSTPTDYPVPSQCVLCRHRIYEPLPPIPCCMAFLGGIPHEFLANDLSHLRPVDYDGGTHFEAALDASPLLVARVRAYFANVDEARAAEGR